MNKFSIAVTLCMGSHLQAAQSSWDASPARLETLRGFLVAHDEAWNSRWPAALEFSMRYETTTAAMQWDGVVAGRRMDARYLLSRISGTNEQLSKVGVGHARWLKCSGREWMEITPHASGDSSRPWTATIMSETPNAFWNYSILRTAREPVVGIALGQILADYLPLQMREDERGVEVDFAVNPATERAVRENTLAQISGFIGLRARFESQCSWRPVEVVELYNFPGEPEGGVLARLETLEVCGSAVKAFRRRTWSNFFKAGSLDLPGAYSMESWVTTDLSGVYVEQHYVEMHTLSAVALQEQPPDSRFALEPPAEAGPCGKISNTLTGDVTIVDARGVHERMRSEDTFVRKVLEEAPMEVVPDGPDYWSLAAYACLFASAVLGGLYVARARAGGAVA